MVPVEDFITEAEKLRPFSGSLASVFDEAMSKAKELRDNYTTEAALSATAWIGSKLREIAGPNVNNCPPMSEISSLWGMSWAINGIGLADPEYRKAMGSLDTQERALSAVKENISTARYYADSERLG